VKQNFKLSRQITNLEKDEKLVLIRVIQEILNNAIKHASPNRIAIKTAKFGCKQ
jgi:signal transduction histidine kinase